MMSRNSIIGLTLIVIGVSMWLVGRLLDLRPIPETLILHLSFVIPGFIIKRWDWFKKIANT